MALDVTRALRGYWSGRSGSASASVAVLVAVAIALYLAAPVAGRRIPALWLVVLGAVAVWLSVGAFRSADRIMRDGNGLIPALAIYAALFNVIVWIGLNAVDVFTGTFPPANAPGPEHFAAVQPLNVSQDGRTAEITGPIDFSTNTRLRVTLEAYPQLAVLRLQSDGGRIHAARALARQVAAQGMATHATGLCASACTIVFIAGTARSLGPDGALGFHGYRMEDVHWAQGTTPGTEEDKDRQFFRDQGVAEDFLDRMYGTPPDDLWRPDRALLVRAGVLTP